MRNGLTENEQEDANFLAGLMTNQVDAEKAEEERIYELLFEASRGVFGDWRDRQSHIDGLKALAISHGFVAEFLGEGEWPYALLFRSPSDQAFQKRLKRG